MIYHEPRKSRELKVSKLIDGGGQMNSSDQNWVSLDPISYNLHHMKIIPREKLL